MMRRMINTICVLIVFIIMFTVNVSAATWKYVWDNTSITIPVGESFDKYKDIPKAVLYKNGSIVQDANITYNTEGDWLFYSKNVNTTKTGVYQVWYKAFDNVYIPGTCTGYKCLVSFYVKDLEKPSLEIINDEIYVKRGGSLDYSSNISYSDNYSKELKVDFMTNTNFDIAGTYQVNVKVEDEGGNYNTGIFKVIVYDESIPEIICLNDDINIPLNETFSIKEYFKASDIYDGDLTDKIELPTIDNSKLGDFNYLATVKNSNGKSAQVSFNVHVIDNKEPVLKLSTHSIVLDYKTDFNNYNFKSYIDKIEDNQEIDYDNLSIKHDLVNKVGKYIITYEYNDGFYTVSDSIDVSLVSYTSPKIDVEDVYLPIDSNIDLCDYITIDDDSDSKIYDSLVIDDSNVSYEKEGTYYAKAFCMNSSGLSTEKRIKIVITSDTKYTELNNGYSKTSIVLFCMVIGLIIFNITYIFISRKNKISKDKNDIEISE